MKTKSLINTILITLALILIISGLSFWLGNRYYRLSHPCVPGGPDTLYIYDTITYHIPDTFPYYIVKFDTIIYKDTIFKDVDTGAILKDYFAYHVMSREWRDSLMIINLRDTITRNNIISSDISYKILRPQTVINVYDYTTYDKYFYGGIGIYSTGIEYSSIDVLYSGPKFSVGLGYSPFVNSINMKAYIPIFKIKQK